MLLARRSGVLRLALLVLPLFASAVATAARGQTTRIEDSELFLSHWSMVVTTTGGSWGAAHLTGGGNPGAYRRVSHHHDANSPVRMESRHWYDAEAVDPDDGDEFESLTFTFDAFAQEGGAPPAGLSRIGVAVVINQGNRVFRSRAQFSGPWSGGWQAVRLPFLAPADYLALDGAPGVPDFSEDGGPFSVGFFVGSVYSTTGAADFVLGVDNFRVEANPVDGPPVASFDRSAMTRSAAGEWVVIGQTEIAAGSPPQPAGLSTRVVLSHTPTQRVVVTAFLEGDPSPHRFVLDPGHRFANLGISLLVPNDGGVSRHFRIASVLNGVTGEPRELLAQAYDRLVPGEPGVACVYCFFVAVVTGLTGEDDEDCFPTGAASSSKADGADHPVQTLRALREQLMATTAAGRYYSRMYEVLSPAISRAIVSRPSLVLDVLAARGSWLDGFAAQLGGHGTSFVITQKMADDLSSILVKLKQAGTSSLARAIAHEEDRLGLDSITGLTIDQLWHRVNDRGGPEACAASETALCLNGGRFRVESDWETADGQEGSGHARALTADSGYFWFFDPANVESVVKVLDGCAVNRRTWAFAAGLTNVRVATTVTDTWTGAGKSYETRQGVPFAPIQDTSAVDACDAVAPAGWKPPAASLASSRIQPVTDAACSPSSTALCLRGGRFQVTADWESADGKHGSGQARPLTGDTGTFWFFDPANTEVVVKVLDGCGLNQRHWVFAGGLTNVRVTLRVTDTASGESRTYVNPRGKAFEPIQDTSALRGCP